MVLHKSNKTLLISATGVFLALGVCARSGQAQDTQTAQPSVAEASRKAKEQQKNEPKDLKVFTNDDVANLKGDISVVGVAPTPPAAAATATTGTTAPVKGTAGAKEPVKDEAYWRGKFADARRKLADDSKELDVLQREYNLKQIQYYSNPDVALREQYSRKDLDDTLAEIDKKKQDVERDNAALEDLQDQLRTSGGEPGWANEPTQPAPEPSETLAPDQQTSPSVASPPGNQTQPNQTGAPTAGKP
jgi:hypothetical protein